MTYDRILGCSIPWSFLVMYYRISTDTAGRQDVAQQILSFAKSESMTGCNVIVDAGWSLS
jgi:hypothetical protein